MSLSAWVEMQEERRSEIRVARRQRRAAKKQVEEAMETAVKKFNSVSKGRPTNARIREISIQRRARQQVVG